MKKGIALCMVFTVLCLYFGHLYVVETEAEQDAYTAQQRQRKETLIRQGLQQKPHGRLIGSNLSLLAIPELAEPARQAPHSMRTMLYCAAGLLSGNLALACLFGFLPYHKGAKEHSVEAAAVKSTLDEAKPRAGAAGLR